MIEDLQRFDFLWNNSSRIKQVFFIWKKSQKEKHFYENTPYITALSCEHG